MDKFYVLVDEEESKILQLLCFKRGIYWQSGSKKIIASPSYYQNNSYYLLISNAITRYEYVEINVLGKKTLSFNDALSEISNCEPMKEINIGAIVIKIYKYRITFDTKHVTTFNLHKDKIQNLLEIQKGL